MDWGALVDVKALAVFMVGALFSIAIAWIAAKGAQLPWLLQKMRDEVSSALVNFSSVALVVGGAAMNITSVTFALVGFIIAWRLP